MTTPPEYIPLYKVLLRSYGPSVAAVYGAVHSIAHKTFLFRGREICDAAAQEIADEAGVTLRTAMTHLKTLVEVGYIEDLTPKQRNIPHVYRLTDKIFEVMK